MICNRFLPQRGLHKMKRQEQAPALRTQRKFDVIFSVAEVP